jgi:hypothetical protein
MTRMPALRTALLTGVLLLGAATAFAQGPRLQLQTLDRLAARAADSTEVELDPNLLRMAGTVIAAERPADAGLTEAVAGLEGVYVRSFQFAEGQSYEPSDLDAIRKQLTTGSWSRVVRAQSKADGETVEVYVWRDGEKTGGLAVLVMEPREVTVVNLIGSLDLAKLAALQGKFGVPASVVPDSPR